MNDAQVPSDVQALERLMATYGDSLLRLCWMLLRDRELARDAAQESFLKAYRAMDRMHAGDTEKAWLTRIAVNTCKDMKRSRWWRLVDRRVTPEDLPLCADGNGAAADGTTGGAASCAAGGIPDGMPDDAPLRAVLALPLKLRQVVLLHYYQGMPLVEIAQALDVPASTVRTRLMRAKERLRQALKGWYYDE